MQIVSASQIRNEIVNTNSDVKNQIKIIREKLSQEMHSKKPMGFVEVDFTPNPVVIKELETIGYNVEYSDYSAEETPYSSDNTWLIYYT